MAHTKYDGIVHAVRYAVDGRILWVRAFLRRGPTWSDHILVDRETLMEKLKAGKQFVIHPKGKWPGCGHTRGADLLFLMSSLFSAKN